MEARFCVDCKNHKFTTTQADLNDALYPALFKDHVCFLIAKKEVSLITGEEISANAPIECYKARSPTLCFRGKLLCGPEGLSYSPKEEAEDD